ncbi:MAG: hypothetical protein ACREIV_06690 [Planctomycetaceae bacterium]
MWEAYPSASKFGFSERPNIVFHCLTDRVLRPRSVVFAGDAADAERAVSQATPQQLLEMLGSAAEVN